MTSTNSVKAPGQPCTRSTGNASACAARAVNEVDRLPVDSGAEVRQIVEPRFLRAPVIIVAPVRDELAQVVDRDPVLPAGFVDLVGETGPRETVAQVVEVVVVDVDPESLHRVRHCDWFRVTGM